MNGTLVAAKLYLRHFVKRSTHAIFHVQPLEFSLEKRKKLLQARLLKLETEMSDVMAQLEQLSSHSKKPIVITPDPLDELEHELRKLETMHELLLKQKEHPKHTLKRIEVKIGKIKQTLASKRKTLKY